MAEKSVVTGKEYDEPKPRASMSQGRALREGSKIERFKNALLSGAVQGASLPADLLLKLLSVPANALGAPEYKFGTTNEAALNKLRKAGLLTDQELTAASGATGYAEDAARYGAMGLTGGGLVRGGIGLATKNIPRAFGGPGALNMIKNVGAYDVALPAATAIPGRYADEISGPGARAITELAVGLGAPAVAGLVRGAKVIPGSTGRNERWALQEMKRMGIDPYRVSPNGDLRLPTFSTGFQELPATASASERGLQATQKGEALRRARETSIGQQNLASAAQENPQRIASMFDTQLPSPSVVPAASREVGGAVSDVTGVVSRPRDVATNNFGDYVRDLYTKAQDFKNDLYGQLGDARKLGKVDAKPLRDAMEDVLGTFEANAMSSGTLSGGMPVQRGGMKAELQAILEKNLSLNENAQSAANKAAQDAAMAQWQKDAAIAKSMMLPEPPMPTGVTGAKVPPINAPDNVSAESLMRMYKDINALWQNATPSEKFLLAKLKAGVNETLEQNPAVAQAFQDASKNNAEFMWMARSTKGNTSPLLSALNARDPQTAIQDYMKNIMTSPKSAEDARRLSAVASKFGSTDELQRLGMAAIEDQASQAAYKSAYANPKEVLTSANAARGVIDKSVDFRNALGIPEDVAAQSSARIAESVERAAPTIDEFTALRDNPSAYFSSLLNKSPDEMQKAADVLNKLSATDPAAATAIRDGLTDAVRRRFTTSEGGFQHGAAASLLGSDDASSLTNFLAPELRDRVVKASKAQQQLEAMRMNPAVGEISSSEQRTAAANAAALAAQGFGAPAGLGYRAARIVEGINLRPGMGERNAMLGNALTDPAYVQQLVNKHSNWDVPYRLQAMPAAAQAPIRTIADKGSQFQISRPPLVTEVPTEAVADDWIVDEEAPASPQKPPVAEDDWVVEDN